MTHQWREFHVLSGSFFLLSVSLSINRSFFLILIQWERKQTSVKGRGEKRRVFCLRGKTFDWKFSSCRILTHRIPMIYLDVLRLIQTVWPRWRKSIHFDNNWSNRITNRSVPRERSPCCSNARCVILIGNAAADASRRFSANFYFQS